MANGSTNSVSFAIAAKYSSLKSIYITQRDNGNGLLAYYPHSSVTGGITDYNFRIGSEIFPPKSPATITEMFAECLKAIDCMSNLAHTPSIERYAYSLNASLPNTSAQEANNASNISAGSFYVGFDAESYPSSNKDQIFSGMSTLNSDIYFQGNYLAPAAQVLRLDAFVMFDSLLVFENDVCYAKS